MTAKPDNLTTCCTRLCTCQATTFRLEGVFILSANQRPLLGRNAILSGLLYGVATYVVMDFLVAPLSAAPKADIMLPVIIEGIIGHALTIGQPLAIVIRRNANADK